MTRTAARISSRTLWSRRRFASVWKTTTSRMAIVGEVRTSFLAQQAAFERSAERQRRTSRTAESIWHERSSTGGCSMISLQGKHQDCGEEAWQESEREEAP